MSRCFVRPPASPRLSFLIADKQSERSIAGPDLPLISCLIASFHSRRSVASLIRVATSSSFCSARCYQNHYSYLFSIDPDSGPSSTITVIGHHIIVRSDSWNDFCAQINNSSNKSQAQCCKSRYASKFRRSSHMGKRFSAVN